MAYEPLHQYYNQDDITVENFLVDLQNFPGAKLAEFSVFFFFFM